MEVEAAGCFATMLDNDDLQQCVLCRVCVGGLRLSWCLSPGLAALYIKLLSTYQRKSVKRIFRKKETNKNLWPNQVEDKWDKFMSQKALNRDCSNLPEEAKKKLSGSLESSGSVGRSWFSLFYGSAGCEF
jgi:hypothetical protein